MKTYDEWAMGLRSAGLEILNAPVKKLNARGLLECHDCGSWWDFYVGTEDELGEAWVAAMAKLRDHDCRPEKLGRKK